MLKYGYFQCDDCNEKCVVSKNKKVSTDNSVTTFLFNHSSCKVMLRTFLGFSGKDVDKFFAGSVNEAFASSQDIERLTAI